MRTSTKFKTMSLLFVTVFVILGVIAGGLQFGQMMVTREQVKHYNTPKSDKELAVSDNVYKEFNETLNKAKEIKVKKQLISWGDKWTVYADDKEVGTIQGRALYLIGDVYVLSNNKGQMIAAEEENWNFGLQDNSASFFNNNKEKVGLLKQNWSWFLYDFEIWQGNKVVGRVQEKFNWTLTVDIKNAETNEIEWHVNKKLLSFGSELTIEKKNQKDISGLEAVWTTVIMNEMSEHDSKKSSHNNN